jgi:site-specific recombinase XerD
MPRVTTKILFDTRRAKKDGLYPVKIRLIYERKIRYYPTPYDFSKGKFNKIMFGERLSQVEKNIKKSIQSFEDKAIEVINSIQNFNWIDFEKGYLANRSAKNYIKDAFDERISELKSNGQIGTSVSYNCAKSSIEQFQANLKFSDITPTILNKYEKEMLDKGCSRTTISIYLRTLRSLFNNAISNKDILPSLYPFRKNDYEKDKYEIPEGSNIKKALELKEIESIVKYNAVKGSVKEMSRDYWFFIYLTNGLNVKDLCLLKYKDIDETTLKFIRAKTIRQKKEKVIYATLRDESLKIIEKWGNKKKSIETYVFPILNGKETPERQRQLIQQLTHIINDNIKSIAEDLEIKKTVTTYSARHSFATVLKRSGASMEVISEMLGHSNLKTTRLYLDSFEKDTLEKTTNALIDFK